MNQLPYSGASASSCPKRAPMATSSRLACGSIGSCRPLAPARSCMRCRCSRCKRAPVSGSTGSSRRASSPKSHWASSVLMPSLLHRRSTRWRSKRSVARWSRPCSSCVVGGEGSPSTRARSSSEETDDAASGLCGAVGVHGCCECVGNVRGTLDDGGTQGIKLSEEYRHPSSVWEQVGVGWLARRDRCSNWRACIVWGRRRAAGDHKWQAAGLVPGESDERCTNLSSATHLTCFRYSSASVMPSGSLPASGSA